MCLFRCACAKACGLCSGPGSNLILCHTQVGNAGFDAKSESGDGESAMKTMKQTAEMSFRTEVHLLLSTLGQW